MPGDDHFPGSLKGGNVEVSAQLATSLFQVNARIRSIERVKKYALLYRRKRIDRFYILFRHIP
jgi:hypothetical protein